MFFMPPRHLDDGDINPDWLEWAEETIAALAQSAGLQLDIGPTGIQLPDAEPDAHWAELTERLEVDGVYRYAFRETRKFDGEVDVFPGAFGQTDYEWAEEANNQAVDVPIVVLVRRDAGRRWLFQHPGAVAPDQDADGGSSAPVSTDEIIVHRNPRCEDGRIVYDEIVYVLHGPVWVEEA